MKALVRRFRETTWAQTHKRPPWFSCWQTNTCTSVKLNLKHNKLLSLTRDKPISSCTHTYKPYISVTLLTLSSGP